MGRAAPAPPAPAPPPDPEPVAADPDQAWKALSLVNDWIKHAEAKTGVVLAVAGVTGGVLYNLVKDQQDPGRWLSAAAIVCGAAVLAAVVLAACALKPRLRLTKAEEPTSRLYFSHIARKYAKRGADYAQVLRDLTKNPEDLSLEIAAQVHANAVVAHRKFFWVNLAVVALCVAVPALAVVASIVGMA